MFDEHFERSVGEILYGASLLQLREECRKLCRVATPVTFSEFIGRICLHQSQLSGHVVKNSNTVHQIETLSAASVTVATVTV